MALAMDFQTLGVATKVHRSESDVDVNARMAVVVVQVETDDVRPVMVAASVVQTVVVAIRRNIHAKDRQ